MLNDKIFWYEVGSFWTSVIKNIQQVDVALDIGCGIVPINFFRPALHIMLEPYKEYVDILLNRHADDKSVFVLSGSAQEVLPHFTNNSVDSVFLIDVIEHLEKAAGFELLQQAERIARQQVVIFTPLGFMLQHAEPGETDAWGLGGAAFQEHLSGWLPEDFGEAWSFHICETYHQYDFRQRLIPEPYGAMFAIRTFSEKPSLSPSKIVDIRRALPSEIALVQAQAELAQANTLLAQTQVDLAQTQMELVQAQSALAQTQVDLAQTQMELVQAQSALAQTQVDLVQTQSALAQALRVLDHPVVRIQRKAWQALKFWK